MFTTHTASPDISLDSIAAIVPSSGKGQFEMITQALAAEPAVDSAQAATSDYPFIALHEGASLLERQITSLINNDESNESDSPFHALLSDAVLVEPSNSLFCSSNDMGVPDVYAQWIESGDAPRWQDNTGNLVNDIDVTCLSGLTPFKSPVTAIDTLPTAPLNTQYAITPPISPIASDEAVSLSEEMKELINVKDQFIEAVENTVGASDKDKAQAAKLLDSFRPDFSLNAFKITLAKARLISQRDIREKVVGFFEHAKYIVAAEAVG